MSDEVEELPDPPLQIFITGRKGQGKSELAYLLWESWPGDRALVDITGDVTKLHPDPDTERLSEPLPARWPRHLTSDRPRSSLAFVPDMGSASAIDEIDRMVGLAYAHGDTLLWVDEFGVAAPANRCKPHMRRALHQGRHRRLSSLLTCPRPTDVETLGIANADVIYAFDLPNRADRERIADYAGYDRSDVHQAFSELSDHGYLRFVAKAKELVIFPPIPLGRHKRAAEAHFEREAV